MMATKPSKSVSRGKKAEVIASKKTMNFYRRKSSFNPKKMIPIILILVVAVGVFVKLGVLNQLDKKVAAYSKIAEKQADLDMMQAKLGGYDELYAQYGRYSYGWMDKNEINTIDRTHILKLVETKIMPSAKIKDLAINGDVITLNLSGITLEDTSNIVKVLEQDELVKRVSVYSATANDASEAEIFMSVVLNKTEQEGK